MLSQPSINPDYLERINKAIGFIDTHLDDELSLDKVAAVACYSPFHFHRLFTNLTGETLNAYVTRKRIEKAAAVLMHKRNVTITELSLKYGFNSNAAFTRTFKKFYGISPSAFRLQCADGHSKIGKAVSKNSEAVVTFEKYICSMEDYLKWIEMNAAIEVKEMPELQVAYIAHVGDSDRTGVFEKLLRWARPKGLLNKPDFRMLTIYHDSFKITPADKVRMSVGMLIDKPVETEGEVSLTTISKGRCVVGHFELNKHDFEKAWRSLFIWLNQQGYTTADRGCFEIYQNDYRQHPEQKFIVDLYIPIN